MCDDGKRLPTTPETKTKTERDVDDLIFCGEQERQVSDR